MFKLIESHFSKLDLFQRFKENSDTEVSELETLIKTSLDMYNISIDEIVLATIENENRIRQLKGHNYWKSILKQTLVNNQDFMDRFIQ